MELDRSIEERGILVKEINSVVKHAKLSVFQLLQNYNWEGHQCKLINTVDDEQWHQHLMDLCIDEWKSVSVIKMHEAINSHKSPLVEIEIT